MVNMKRSEALKLIEGLFELAPRFDNKTNAENLLSNLEELGMLPPYIPTNASGWEIGKGANAYINEWEQE